MSTPLNDLTIYDRELPQEYKDRLSCIKILYYIIFGINVALLILSTIGMVINFNIFSLVFVVLHAAFLTFALAYGSYPTREISRNIIVKIILICFFAYYVFSLFSLIIFMFIYRTDIERNIRDNDTRVSFAALFVAAIVIIILPISLCVVLFLMFRIRKGIAADINQRRNQGKNFIFITKFYEITNFG